MKLIHALILFLAFTLFSASVSANRDLRAYAASNPQATREVSSYGTIATPQIPPLQLGVYGASSSPPVPADAEYVVVGTPNYTIPRKIPVILDWYYLHPPYPNGINNPYVTVADVKTVEDQLKTVQASSFWGIIGPVCEETYRSHIQFEDSLNTTWFNETLLGYATYLTKNPGATRDSWQDEMFLRFVRGFYNYFHLEGLHVGITAADDATNNTSYFYGQPAFAFIRQSYDFVFLYAYTENLTDFEQRTKPYFSAIDQLFQNQMKFWILTRMYDFSVGTWQLEAKAIELKNCFDRNMVVTTSIYEDNPTFQETWTLIEKAKELYDTNAPYYETYVNGTNLLTGYVGNTYGWVQAST